MRQKGKGRWRGIRCGSIQVIFNGRIPDEGIQEEQKKKKTREKSRRAKVLTAVFDAVRFWGRVPMNTHTQTNVHTARIY